MDLSDATEKSPVTPPVIDSGTFGLVAQCLNHYATPGPTIDQWTYYINSNQQINKLLTVTNKVNKAQHISVRKIVLLHMRALHDSVSNKVTYRRD
jgi:hypothetical protein